MNRRKIQKKYKETIVQIILIIKAFSIRWRHVPISCSRALTLISLVCISPSEATSWCVNTYLSHFDRAFSLGADTWMELGMTGCKTVPKSILELGLWSTHFSPPAERERRCNGRTGVDVFRAGWQLKGRKKNIHSWKLGRRITSKFHKANGHEISK